MITSDFVMTVKDGRAQVEVSTADCLQPLWAKIYELLGERIDDAGCDWYTDAIGNTYIGGSDWIVSTDPTVALLVNAANYMSRTVGC